MHRLFNIVWPVVFFFLFVILGSLITYFAFRFFGILPAFLWGFGFVFLISFFFNVLLQKQIEEIKEINKLKKKKKD